MAINPIASRFLLMAKRSGVDFIRTATLGHQRMNLDSSTLQRYMGESGIEGDAFPLVDAGYSDEFFRFLGTQELFSFDASKYEQADVEHDMNLPIPKFFHGRFSTVFDGGTLEHVFDFKQAIANCMLMLEVGGHFLAITPTNNLSGHGFYQFSPELFFRVFDHENGFEMVSMIVVEQEDNPPFHYVSWEQAIDPKVLGVRIETRTGLQTCLLVCAKRVAAVEPLFQRGVQQSDYSTAWGK